MPKRIQRKRSKGWRMPDGAVYVGRPTVFGNPWPVDGAHAGLFKPDLAPGLYAKEFRAWLECDSADESSVHAIYRTLAVRRREILRRLPELRGKDLACWCPLGAVCHADVLLELANREGE